MIYCSGRKLSKTDVAFHLSKTPRWHCTGDCTNLSAKTPPTVSDETFGAWTVHALGRSVGVHWHVGEPRPTLDTLPWLLSCRPSQGLLGISGGLIGMPGRLENEARDSIRTGDQ